MEAKIIPCATDREVARCVTSPAKMQPIVVEMKRKSCNRELDYKSRLESKGLYVCEVARAVFSS